MIEVNTERRGHEFLPDSIANTIPPLYSQDGKGTDATAYLHYFVGSADWYISELDQETGEAFGWAEILPGGGELGYIFLPELEKVLAQGLFPVERDLHWTPKSIQEALSERNYA